VGIPFPTILPSPGTHPGGPATHMYQGERRWVHPCIPDELDPYAPSAPHQNRDSGVSSDKPNPNSPVIIASSQSREDLASSPAPRAAPSHIEARKIRSCGRTVRGPRNRFR
jgi:hypothetical protein